MGVIRRNLIANFAGQGWIALMGFVFVPFYLRLLGAEGYGLIGFFVLLTSTLSLLDMGFNATATRQIVAYLEADDEKKVRIASLLRSIEAMFWAIAVLAGVLVAVGAPLIATHWLNVDGQRVPEATTAIRLMAVAIVVQFPIDFYNGCLIGLQRQVRLNVINSVAATMRGAGAVLVLWFVSPTVKGFFAWQCILTLTTVISLRYSLWKNIGTPKTHRWIDPAALREVGSFTAGVGGINVLSYLLTQLDKIILSRILPLSSFGYYTLAWTLGTFAYRFTGPIFNAYYPRIAQLVTQGGPGELVHPNQETELVGVYLKASRVMAIAIVPFSVWLAFFGKELLTLWTHDPAVAEAAAGAVTLIALGTMCNGFMHIPYGLQLASGWIRLAFWQNVTAIVLIVPLTFYFATHYGITGAALPWMILNIGYVVVGAPLMYRLMLQGTKWNWYRSSVVYPILQASCLTGMFYLTARRLGSPIGVIALMAFALFVSVTLGAWRSGLVSVREVIQYCKAYG
jgi:O-antigen/teichoic acid export membrane protein